MSPGIHGPTPTPTLGAQRTSREGAPISRQEFFEHLLVNDLVHHASVCILAGKHPRAVHVDVRRHEESLGRFEVPLAIPADLPDDVAWLIWRGDGRTTWASVHHELRRSFEPLIEALRTRGLRIGPGADVITHDDGPNAVLEVLLQLLDES